MNIRSSKKKEIIDATLALIAERGMHNTPMSLVSKVSGIAAGTIYHHFDSKETLINEVYLSIKKAMLTNIMKKDDDKLPYKERFFTICETYFDYLVENPHTLSFLEQCSNIPIIKAEVKKETDALAEPLTNFFHFGISNGIIANPDIEIVLSLINGTIVNLAKLQLSGEYPVTEAHKFSAIQYAWKGLI